MKLTIRTYFKACGQIIEQSSSPCIYDVHGWKSVDDMRAELRRRNQLKPGCQIEEIPNGLRITTEGAEGWQRQDVTQSD